MVAEGYWPGCDATPALPGVPGIPVSNYLGWLRLRGAADGAAAPAGRPGRRAAATGGTHPMFALYLWTYVSSVLAHAVFLGLPASALWGAAGMAVAAVPLAVTLLRARRPARRTATDQPHRPGVDATR